MAEINDIIRKKEISKIELIVIILFLIVLILTNNAGFSIIFALIFMAVALFLYDYDKIKFIQKMNFYSIQIIFILLFYDFILTYLAVFYFKFADENNYVLKYLWNTIGIFFTIIIQWIMYFSFYFIMNKINKIKKLIKLIFIMLCIVVIISISIFINNSINFLKFLWNF